MNTGVFNIGHPGKNNARLFFLMAVFKDGMQFETGH
jgi:hypothetical protein